MPRAKFTESIAKVLESWGLPRRPAPTKGACRELDLFMPIDSERIFVGMLLQDGNQYVFRYSQEFQARQDLPPISAFPDKFREYRSARLWPFFEVRVPPTDRPDVRQVVDERGIDSDDVFRLLGELGRRAISSPYEFELAKA